MLHPARKLALAAILVLLAACTDANSCDGTGLHVTGEFRTDSASFVFATAGATVVHRRDVDAWEDGVITEVTLDLSMGEGCTLHVEAAGCVDAGNRLPITTATFTADAFCPGFPQETEGLYLHTDEALLGTLTLADPQGPGSNKATACFSSEMDLDLAGTLHSAGTGEPLQVLASTITLSGRFHSTGTYSPGVVCGGTVIDSDTRSDLSGDLTPADVPTVDLPAGPKPAVTLTIHCPDCEADAPVRFYAAKGWEIVNAEYVIFFQDPTFPIQETLELAEDPAGVPVPWPEGNVTFRAYQDTTPGGSVPEAGEPVSELVTIDVVAGHLNVVELTLDTGGQATIECTPETDYCVSLKVSAHCHESGTDRDLTECPDDHACNEKSGLCQQVICAPSKVTCADADHTQVCLNSGTGYSEPTACNEGYVCMNGQCMNEECLGEVIFLVDTSQSMAIHWESVGNSIEAITALSPMASFGLATFPESLSICEVSTSLQLAMEPNQAAAINTWFDENQPFGQTPLLQAMKTMNEILPDLFLAEGGALVLLSDGADTCAYTELPVEEQQAQVVQELSQWTATLHADHGIKTYVVGYQYQGNPDQLVAIAANGGTGKETYTPAGNEAELTSVLVSIAEDLKLCFE